MSKKPDELGYVTQKGTVYAGQNKNGAHCYTPPTDAGFMNKNKAAQLLAQFNETGELCGCSDWDFPTGWNDPAGNDELDMLYKNKDEIGNFNSNGETAASRYGSSSDFEGNVCGQSFANGEKAYLSESLDEKYAWRFLRKQETLDI